MSQDKDPYNARIVERRLLHASLAIFRIAYEDVLVPDFEPGQFTNLGLIAPPKPQPAGEAGEVEGPQARRRRAGRVRLTRRAYSICSPPKEKRWLEFYIVAVDEGALTPRVFDLDVGDRLFMDPKIKGRFTLEGVPEGKDLVTVATGTGIAPFLSMYQQYKDDHRWERFVFIHGVRLARDLGYHDTLLQIAKDDPRVHYLPIVSRETDSTWAGLRGRVTSIFQADQYEQLVGAPLSPEQCHIFLCGNPAMIDQLEEELTAKAGPGFIAQSPRVTDGNLHFERYW
ncbi:MAG: ferredoxin--NADP reductase [Phycisphaerales bacterium JB063]